MKANVKESSASKSCEKKEVPMIKHDSRITRHAHFDCFSGAAGDMMLASCIDASAIDGKEKMLQTIKLGLMSMKEIRNEFDLSMKQVLKGPGSIAASKVTVHSIYDHKIAPVPMRSFYNQNQHTHETQNQHDTERAYLREHDHKHDHNHHSYLHNEGNHSQHEVNSHTHDHEASHAHSPSHSHSHSHCHRETNPATDLSGEDSSRPDDNTRGHQHSHSHSSMNGGPLRNFTQISTMIDSSSLPLWVKRTSMNVFAELARAEAMTHGCDTIDQVHFHEVGAIDSIVDTVGTVYALYLLNVTSVSCSHLPMGEGNVMTEHGLLPVPAPATLRLMQDMHVCPGPPGVTGELVTPTAAALLKVLTRDTENTAGYQKKVPAGRPPHMTIRSVGLGAGTKEFPKHANIIRLVIGDLLHSNTHDNSATFVSSPLIDQPRKDERRDTPKDTTICETEEGDTTNKLQDTTLATNTTAPSNPSNDSTSSLLASPLWTLDNLVKMEANIDDTSAEVMAYTVQTLLKGGAIDAWITPIVMKKGRAAHTIHCLCHKKSSKVVHDLLETIFRQTSTLGIRVHHHDVDRVALQRRVIHAQTPFVTDNTDGRVSVKVGYLGKEITSMSAEFDHCRIVADSTGAALKLVAEAAVSEAKKIIQEEE